jgi:branched-chain amino acid transport system substrate-binding protein
MQMSYSNRFAFLAVIILGLTVLSGCSGSVEIGAVLSQSGAAKLYGDEVRNGIDLALEEINAEGGVNGSPLSIIFRDDETKPSVAREQVTNLIEEHNIRVMIGGVASPVMLEIGPIANEAGVILLSPSASSPKVTQLGLYVFRIHPSDILEGTNMAELARDLGIERMAVFAVDNEFGSGLSEVFALRYESKYRKIVESFQFPEGGGDVLVDMVAKVKEQKPEGIYIVGYLSDVATLTRMLREAGVEAVIIGNAGITAKITEMIGDAAENLIFPQPSFDLDNNDAVMQQFIAAFKARYGKDPDRFAALGYDSLRLIHAAMELGGTAHPQTVRSSLRHLKDYQGASGRINFDENGDVVQYPKLFIIRDGAMMPYQKFLDEGGELKIPGK